jgi:hypothetical protein
MAGSLGFVDGALSLLYTWKTDLARIIQSFYCAGGSGMSAALRSVGHLDVKAWSKAAGPPARPSVARRWAKRRIHARLRCLATNLHY